MTPLAHSLYDVSTSEDPELWLRQYAEQAQLMTQRAQEMQVQLAQLEGECHNRYITLKVNAGGALEDIRFSQHFRTMSDAEMAEVVKDAYAAAYADVNARAQELVASIGPGSEQAAAFVGEALTPDMRARAERAAQQEEDE